MRCARLITPTRRSALRLGATALAVSALGITTHEGAAPRGVRLSDISWTEAAQRLGPDTVVIIPIGAGAKEHGPHLTLANDFLLAEYFAARVVRDADVVLAPTIPYHFYPAFVEYPGSTTLRLETARDMAVDICRGLSRFGPRRFYALNTGISTRRALAPAADLLAREGLLLRYTDLAKAMGPFEAQVRQQEGGTHADEIETSMMLYIAPKTVDMRRAVRDYHEGNGPLTRDPNGPGVYSPSGVYGDPTLATRAKGKILVEGLTTALLADIAALREAPLPAAAGD